MRYFILLILWDTSSQTICHYSHNINSVKLTWLWTARKSIIPRCAQYTGDSIAHPYLNIPNVGRDEHEELARDARSPTRWTSYGTAPTISTPIRSIVGRPIVHRMVGTPVLGLLPRGGAYPGAKFRSSVRVHKRETLSLSLSPQHHLPSSPRVAPSISLCRSFVGAGTPGRMVGQDTKVVFAVGGGSGSSNSR